MDITCSAEPCPIVLSATCVFYEGNNLIYTGINNNDNLEIALQKIDQKFQDAGLGYIFSNGIEQLTPGGAVMLGGALNKNTTIGGLYNLAFAGTLEASALVTTGGTSSQFVKGDGSLDSTSYQPSGNYISNLTGDVTANGPGSVTATLATVFGAPGTYGNSGNVPSITVDGKGRITNVTPIPINYPAQSLSFVGDVDGFGFTGSPVTLTLDTVNTDIYGSNNFLKFAVNGKGLITSATPVSGGDITTTLGYVPVDDAIELTINGVAHDLTSNRSWSVGTVTTVGVTAGLGISASVSNPNTIPVINIVNTAPDQTVTLNAGYGISISGSYPNFTITNDYPDLPEKVTSFSSGNLVPLFTTSVATPTTTPALSFALANAAANTVFAGPDGGAGTPTYRALVAADIPSLSYISSISVSAPLATTGGLTPTISISQANASTDGYLSTTDWNTFNNKQNALGYTPVPDTRQLGINGVNYDLTADRCWSVGTVTSITASAPLTGGTITGSGSVGITQAGAGSDGYLSSTDWNTFNGKQPAGNYITDLTGDGTASGPGSAGLTLATVNATTGTFGSSTQVPVITVNNKGLVTCVTTSNISGSLEFIGDVTGTGSTGTCTSLTLATVNNDVYTSETLLNIAVNGKGLITSANPTTAGDICSTLGYSPEDVANKSTCTSLGVSNTLYPTQLAVKTYVDSATAGGIILQGDWDAATNTPDISGTTTTGWAWRVSVAGTTNLGGITDWQVGDLAVKSATGWVKIDNSDGVTSVFGRFGAVVATTGDYLSCQVTECGNLYYTDARVRAAIGHTAPLTYCSTTGVFGITQSNTTTDGYLSATDWTTFNDKQPLIAAGTISQYYRGDKTFQTLDTSVVTEGTNLYFTDSRARSAICASSGVAYNPTTGQITNSCPDQIVSLTGGGTTSITGTYPNFTITSSDSFTGTVTCVAVSGTNIGVTGSPITSAGTIGLSLSGANVCNALGYTPYNATNPAGYTTCTGTVTNIATSTSTTGVLLSGSPITSSGTLGINISTASTACTGLLTAADWNTFNSHTSCTGTVTSVGLTSSTTGVSIGGSPITSSGNLSLNIATASSTCTGLLTAADWNSFNSRTSCTGTVTCVAATGTNISVTGSPITTSGTLAISLSGANVCSALGYTPYNATNPNGYTTCTGTVTSVGVVATNINVCNSPVTTSGNICLNLTGANVCSALGYTPAQLNGSVLNTFSVFQLSYESTNFNPSAAPRTTMNPMSIKMWNNYFNGTGLGSDYGTVMQYYSLGSHVDTQVYFDASGGSWYRTSPYASGWGVWQNYLTSSNYNSYSPTLTGGGASGTWGINITGSAGSASSVAWAAITGKPSNIYYYQGFTLDANTMDTNASGFTYSVNAPYTGPIERIGDSNYSLQFNAAYSGGGTGIAFRTRNGDAGTFNTWRVLLNDANYTAYSPSLTGSGASGTWSITATGNVASRAQSNWNDSTVINNVVGLLSWKNYGNNHVIFDASASVNPSGGGCSNTNSTAAWSATYPTLMGWNGTSTYGVRVDSARVADSATLAPAYLPLAGGTLTGPLTIGTTVNSVIWNDGTGTYMENTGNSAATRVIRLQAHNGSFSYTQLFVNGGGGYVEVNNQMRAPIYYDSQDTGYYLDPNSTSRLNQVQFLNRIGIGNGSFPYINTGSPGVWLSYGGGSDQFMGAQSSTVWGVYVAGDWKFTVNSAGTAASVGDFRAPIFYDSNDTAYYVDPNSESNLYRFTSASMTRNAINYLSINSPFVTRSGQGAPYQNGTMGWATTDFNVIFSNWGSGFFDTWSSPGNAPGGSSHYVGFNAMHYNHQNNVNGYGFQMTCAGEAVNRYFWRNGWATLNAWVEMIHSGNIGSQSVSYATSAGSVNQANVAYLVNGTSGGAIQTWDVRTISPSTMTSYRMGFGFTSWANNNSAPYADYLHLRSYSDGSGGSDNLVTFLKSGFGMRIWQQSFGSTSPYSSYVDVLHSGNYSSYALPVNGNWIGNTGMNDQRLFLRTNGDLNHYLWNAADDWEELNAYEGTGFRITSVGGSVGVLYVYGSSNGGYTYSPYSFRAPIFYDSNDTNYYLDPNGSSVLSTVYLAGTLRNSGSVSDDDGFGVYWDSSASAAYAIYREAGSWSFPYPDLRIAFHTGIKFGANANYKGMNFYTDYDMSSLVMSVNNNDYNTGGIYVHGTAYASAYYETSDARVKTILEDNSRVKDIQLIKPKLYKKDGKTEFGYIAQDFLEIMPYAVNNDNVDNMYSLVYREVHTAKIAYIEDEVDVLKRRVAELEVKLQKYEA